MLARAFHDDPFWRWLAPFDRYYRQRLERGFAAQLRLLAFPAGEVHTTAEDTGAALWSPPGTWDTRLRTQLRFLPALVPVCGPARLPSRVLGIQRIQALHPREPHWYLQVLGVDPPHQGKGHASRLLAPLLERCDRDNLPCWLETANEANLSLYRRFGFEVAHSLYLPARGPRLWCMLRPALRTAP